ncbi:MAG: hypothetical protein GY765_37465, partial [bacterium]|nr:hypothetical protein [bacterium]
FAGICLTAPESVTYKFQLEGRDSSWHDTKERSVFYSYLPPRKYTFQVKAFNNDGVESLKPAEFSFVILPPFWATWWFYTLSILAFVLLTFFLFRFYYKRVEEKRTLEARTRQLVMSQRMELMGMLAAGAVHDMKNLMAIIIGYSNVIKRDAHIDDKSNRLLVNIKDTANTAANMVKQILKFSSPQKSTRYKTANMVPMLDDILELLKVTIPGRIQLHWQPPAEKISTPLTPVHLQQIVMNLCVNAVHAMPTGGTLEITLDDGKGGTPSHGKGTPSHGGGTPSHGEGALLEISDNGCGMEKEIRDRIFDPLFTTKEDGKGTGLGLFVTRQLVEQYNGIIRVQSEPGKGTRFSIEFPA